MSLTEELPDHNKAENYLLGTLTDDEAFDFECDVFPDENLSEQLEIVRHRLSEKYLNDELNQQQKKQFEEYFLASAYNSEIFAFQKSLKAEIDQRNLIIEEEKEEIPAIITDEKKNGILDSIG